MKRLKKLGFLIICSFAAAAAVFPFASCAKEKDLKDILPDKFGESEGLYLYRGNTKSRTDGSEKQHVLQSAEIDGVTYGEGEFTVLDCAYATAVNKIFFTLRADRKEFLYRYDYKECTGENLYTDKDLTIYKSEKYIYATGEDNGKGLLYSVADATLVCDEIYGKLDGEVLYKSDSVYDETERDWKARFSYFYDGTKREVFAEQHRFDLRYLHISENYAYFLTYHSPCAINLTDGTLADLPFDDEVIRNYETVACADGLYTLTLRYETDGEDTKHINTLYKLTGGSAEVAYEFGDCRYGNKMQVLEGNLFFTVGNSRGESRYRYDPDKKKLRKVSSFPKEKPSRTQEITVGGYNFYVENKRYNEYQFPGYLPIPIPNYKWCYFLYREKDGKTDVMQYSTESRKLFDDICEF